MDTKQAYVFDNDGFLDTNKKVRVLVSSDVIEDLREIRAEITRVNEAAGRTVFNPADNDREMEKRDEPINIRTCLGHDLAWICKDALAIALLPGWRNSKGATAEHATAVALGLKVIEL